MKHKIGLLNVGHAPRVDNKSLVANFFRSTGVDCEIIERATFEGETFEEIHKLEGPDYDPNAYMYSPDTRCGAFVHREGINDIVLGEGWYEVWTPRKENIPRIQRNIDYLEAQGAEIIIMCCCLRYPVNCFKSRVPLILPWTCTFNYVKNLVQYMDRPQVGIVIGRGQNVERDIDMWTDNEWSKNVDFHWGIGHLDGNGEKALMGKKLDLVVVWGWHTFDLEYGKVSDKECMEIRWAKQFNCPVISSASATLLFARGYVRPPLDEKSYYLPLYED